MDMLLKQTSGLNHLLHFYKNVNRKFYFIEHKLSRNKDIENHEGSFLSINHALGEQK